MHCPFALPRSLFWAFHLHSTEAEVKAPGGERMGSASLGLVQRPPTWGCEESTCVVCSLLWSEWRNSLLSQRKIIFFTSQTHFFCFIQAFAGALLCDRHRSRLLRAISKQNRQGSHAYIFCRGRQSTPST